MSDEYENTYFFNKYYKKILKYCFSRLHCDHQAAEEAASDAIRIFIEKKDMLDKTGNIDAWLYRTADNCVKRKKKEIANYNSHIVLLDDMSVIDSTSVSFEEELLGEETSIETIEDNMISCLPEDLKLIFEYRYVKDKTLLEISRETGIPYSTVWNKIRRIKEILKSSNYLK